ncbi:MAG TPA: cytochrome c oxidase assembly protein [Solirubrobacteraceae bacterium]|nr:cytochrome c oxidase assembly protein [Solirubrobacteraceae bacterium]
MGAVLHGWTFEPIALCVLVLAAWHELGLRKLLARSRRDRVAPRRRRALWFYAGGAVVMLAVLSPLEQRGYDYFYVRISQHLLLMFVAPVLLVLGAPWQPLVLGLPLRLRRRLYPWLVHARGARPLRRLVKALVTPVVAVVCFNVVMVGALLPAVFDFSERVRPVHVWLFNGGFLFAGLIFWLLIVPSPPLRVRAADGTQVVALLVTNVIMWILAISMALFSRHPWYSVYAHIPGASLSQASDQQLGAGILWVCGDLWAIPPLVFAAYRVFTRESEAAESTLLSLAGVRRGAR